MNTMEITYLQNTIDDLNYQIETLETLLQTTEDEVDTLEKKVDNYEDKEKRTMDTLFYLLTELSKLEDRLFSCVDNVCNNYKNSQEFSSIDMVNMELKDKINRLTSIYKENLIAKCKEIDIDVSTDE